MSFATLMVMVWFGAVAAWLVWQAATGALGGPAAEPEAPRRATPPRLRLVVAAEAPRRATLPRPRADATPATGTRRTARPERATLRPTGS